MSQAGDDEAWPGQGCQRGGTSLNPCLRKRCPDLASLKAPTHPCASGQCHLAFRQCVQVRALAVFDKLASTKGQRAGHSMCAEDLVQGERARCTRVKTQESRLKTRCYTAASRQPDSFSPPSLACRVNTSASYILYVQINADYASCPTAAQIISRQTQASTQASSSLIQPRPSTTREPQPSTTRLLAISPSNQTDANPRRRAPSRRPILRPPT